MISEAKCNFEERLTVKSKLQNYIFQPISENFGNFDKNSITFPHSRVTPSNLKGYYTFLKKFL